MSSYDTYDTPNIKRGITGFDDSVIYTLGDKSLAQKNVNNFVKTLIIALIPFPGIGSLHAQVIIPIMFYMFFRSYLIVALMILFWIVVQFCVYTVFGVWNLGEFFGFNYHKTWEKKLVPYEKKGKKSKKKTPKKKKENASDVETQSVGPFGLSLTVMESLKLRKLARHTEKISLFLKDIGYEKPTTKEEKRTEILVTNIFINTVVSLVATLFVFYAVRAFNLQVFTKDDQIEGQLIWEPIVLYIPLAFQGAITAWLANLIALILLWGLFAPLNGLYSDDNSFGEYAPYLFLSVIIVYFMIVFSRMYLWFRGMKVYPWPTDERYYINTYFGLSFAFWIVSLIYTIVDG